MSDAFRAAIGVLQNGGDDAHAQHAFAEIADMLRRQPRNWAAELSRAILEEVAAGELRTPRLLALLGMTREPAPDCVSHCLKLLRVEANTLPPSATLGAAAIVARTNPRALLPDLSSKQNPEGAQEIAQVLPLLFGISSQFLAQSPDHGFTDMARWLWYDCAVADLMSLVDFAAVCIEQWGPDDPLVELLVDLIERAPVSADEKKYACEVLQKSGVADEVVEQLETAYRAICVAPAVDASEPVNDPEPPAPDARVDEWLAAFSEDDPNGVELARAAIDQIFEDRLRSKALAWWVAVSVDALPLWRRRRDIDWALVQFATALRRHGENVVVLPPSLLQRWLDTPQLLNARDTKIALDLLSRQQPGLVAQRYLHRAVAASSERHAEILVGGLWRSLIAAEPAAVLAVASRWIAFAFGQNDFLILLVDVLQERAQAEPALIDELAQSVASTPQMSRDSIATALNVLDLLREQPQERRHA